MLLGGSTARGHADRYSDIEFGVFEQTYSDAADEHMWEALFTMCALFRITAIDVAAQFGFAYPYGDDEKVSAHLQHVRRLP